MNYSFKSILSPNIAIFEVLFYEKLKNNIRKHKSINIGLVRNYKLENRNLHKNMLFPLIPNDILSQSKIYFKVNILWAF